MPVTGSGLQKLNHAARVVALAAAAIFAAAPKTAKSWDLMRRAGVAPQ